MHRHRYHRTITNTCHRLLHMSHTIISSSSNNNNCSSNNSSNICNRNRKRNRSLPYQHPVQY